MKYDITRLKSHQQLLQVSGITVVAILVLTWLLIKAVTVTPEEHFNYTQELRGMREADTEVDGELLAGRLGLSRNYDALNTHIAKLISAGKRVRTPPIFLLAADTGKVRQHALKLHKALTEKSQLIDRFKRHNAILRNSIAFFQRTAEDYPENTPEDEVHQAVEHYVRQTMFYLTSPDPVRLLKMQQTGTELNRTSTQNLAGQQIRHNLLQHGLVISKTLSQVDQLTRQILNLPTARRHGALTTAYIAGHDNAQQMADRYRIVLYVLALLLTGYLAYTVLRLDRTSHSLRKAHQEVTERYEAQSRAEKQLRLHATAFNNAHEGITLTETDGTIIDVNPAFTRITGYERNEVIGHNPRVLKSGRHDESFYHAMWSSLNNTGTWRGEIWNRNKFGEIYPELLSISAVHDKDAQLSNYVAVFSDISRLKAQEKQLEKMAYYDALTELPNRVLLTDRINQAIAQTVRSKSIMALCYLDLDGFKPINDKFGHDSGDRLLVEMANRFRAALRGGDTVARLGGDEFVLLLLGLKKIEECEQAMQRLLRAISQPIPIEGTSTSISASIGVTIYPDDSSDADTLLRHADQSMYLAKQQGKDCYHVFDPDQDSFARGQHERFARIESALRNNEMLLYYQPQVNLRDGKVVGMEALIRWAHPESGLVPPNDFLPLIEDKDLIVHLGNWVIDSVLAQMECRCIPFLQR